MDKDRIRRLVADTVERHGYEFVDLELKGSGNNAVLRVFVDKPAGLTLGDCELVSDQVGAILDVEDPIPFAYTLEVSSPGIERKLIQESDYARFEGRLAKIQTRLALNNQRVFRGRLRGLQNGKVRLELPKGNLLEIPFDVVAETRLEFDWEEERARLRQQGNEE